MKFAIAILQLVLISTILHAVPYQVQHQEKVYLHFDNTGYYLQETMWFKAYVLDESNRPTDISGILYVELVSPEGGVVKSNKYKLQNGTCHGDIYLDSAYQSGFFEVRAYTRYMRNFGEDNYFSRVFPVYDIAKDGHYEYRTMFNRTRTDCISNEIHKENLSPWKRKKKRKQDTIPDEVRESQRIVKQYYETFKPQPITVISEHPQPHHLSPGDSVVMTFQATPHSTFSLSITDRDNRIRTHYNKNIYNGLYKDSEWVERSFIALRDYNAQKDIFRAPEKELTIDGQIWYWKKNQKTPLPHISITLSMNNGEKKYSGTTQSDKCGLWAFTIDDFYGDCKAGITNDARKVHVYPTVSVHKWFSPPPRTFLPEEVCLPESPLSLPTDHIILQDTVDQYLQEVKITGKKTRHHWVPVHTSLVHYNYEEEYEYMLDHFGAPALGAATNVGSSILRRYHYPFGAAHWMIPDKYDGDNVVPQGVVNTYLGDLPDNIKEVVIRSDYATCLKYNRADRELMKEYLMDKDFRPSSQLQVPNIPEGPRTRGLLKWNQDLRNPNNPRNHFLHFLVCYIPYSPEEQEAPRSQQSYKESASFRYTIVKGFTPSATFHSPDYTHGLPEDVPDYRRTLYWNPEVQTDENGRASVTFYNNSTCHSLHISAEGIGADGNPILYNEPAHAQ